MRHFLPLNAFSSITIHGLVSDGASGEPYAQTLHRGVVKPGRQIKMKSSRRVRPNGIPRRPPSNLPPPGDRHLTLHLGERLGAGRVGSVHDVAVMEIATGVELPPLVVKVSQWKKSGSLAQEAWFYEELEQLQGVSVPWCYGFFQTRLRDDQHVLTWTPESDESEDEEQEGASDEIKYERALPGQGNVLSILVLEKLGGNIPVGESLDPSIENDVYDVFNDIARLGIEPMDIRWSNILSARNDSPGSVCPNHGHVHCWRLIDFDLCRKSDATTQLIDGCNHTWLRRLFDNLVEGRIVEPWD